MHQTANFTWTASPNWGLGMSSFIGAAGTFFTECGFCHTYLWKFLQETLVFWSTMKKLWVLLFLFASSWCRLARGWNLSGVKLLDWAEYMNTFGRRSVRGYTCICFFFKSKCYVRINVSYAGSRDGTFNPLFGYLTHSRDCMRRIYWRYIKRPEMGC
jgi:hypothetical protein